ncbi:MAG: hypothetical protein LBG58_13065 [Planctomycetaceae bacterium]|jgi:hypothetical protein|nr:hypothetical protein [Planctomycetaceae bacterium]
MAIPFNTNILNDNTVGLVGISSHQAGWRDLFWFHNPHPVYVEGPRNIGTGAGRLQRSPLMQQFTGHTAVMSRLQGQINFVRGFVPYGFVATMSMLTHWALPILPWGREVAGHWQNDLAMAGDPTCASIEIQVGQGIANGFQNWVFNHENSINRYSLQDSDAIGSFNCVAAAETLLLDFLYGNQIVTANISDFENILFYYGNVSQGSLMRMIVSLPGRI